RVADHPPVRQVAAHMQAEGVQHVEAAVLALEDHQLGAEGLDRVRLAVLEHRGRTQAVPAARIAGRDRAGFDLANGLAFGQNSVRHLSSPKLRYYEFRNRNCATSLSRQRLLAAAPSP